MKTKYVLLGEETKHNIVENFPNKQIKKCLDKSGNFYMLHIIYPEDIVYISKLSKSDAIYFCGKKYENSEIITLRCNWFPKELVVGVENKRYTMNSELSKLTGFIDSVNLGSSSEAFLKEKVINAINILKENNFLKFEKE